jgi:SlyX protein
MMEPTNTPTDNTTDQRLTDLEIKASFSEDLLDQLNQVIVRQQQEIDLLMREVRQLRLQMPEGAGPAQSRTSEELPPHY